MATIYTHIAANKRRSFFLVLFFAAFLLALGWVVYQLSGSDVTFLLLAVFLALFMPLIGYWGGDSIVLWTTGARRITKEQNPYVYRLVENLCITAGLPVPKIYLIPDSALNAFATGRDPKHASIALTTGIVETLENEELEGVLAHELSHVGNFDTRFMMLVAVLVGLVLILSDLFLRSWLWRGRSDRDNRIGPVLALLGLVFIILSPIIAQLIQLAVSRRREFLADASGALLTRYPQGLASALAKIGAMHKPMRHASTATAHLYFANPFGRKGGGIAGLFATHPAIEQRIRALQEMAGANGR